MWPPGHPGESHFAAQRPITRPMAAFKEVSPGRLEIREGGGCLALFGLPFFATGIFMVLASLGVVTMRSDGETVTQATAF